MKAYLHKIADKYLNRLDAINKKQSLPAVKPLLTYIADDYWKPVTEHANKREIAMIKKRAKEFPNNFVPLN